MTFNSKSCNECVYPQCNERQQLPYGESADDNHLHCHRDQEAVKDSCAQLGTRDELAHRGHRDLLFLLRQSFYPD